MTVGGLHASAIVAVAALPETSDHVELSLRQAVLGFLEAQPEACSRSNVPGHVTASTLVFDHDRSHILLTLHPRLRRWVQLGGHCEPADVDVLAAAGREAHEESGIASLALSPTPFALRVHALTCSLGVPTRHFDLYFVATAAMGSHIVRSEESDDLQWWPVDALPGNSDIGDLVTIATRLI